MTCEACGHRTGDPLPRIPVGLLLKEARLRLGWTQENVLEVALLSDRDINWLSRIERNPGDRTPPWPEWEALCVAVRIDPVEAADGRRPR